MDCCAEWIMNLREHDGREDMKVWLADQEVEQPLEVASDVDVEHYLAIGRILYDDNVQTN